MAIKARKKSVSKKKAPRQSVATRKKVFHLAKGDHKLVRFYLPLVTEDSIWSIIRKLAYKIDTLIGWKEKAKLPLSAAA